MNDSTEKTPGNDNRSLTGKLLLIAAAMFGFGYLLVPLYDVFCEITGFGGRTNTVAETSQENPDYTRLIRVEFVTTVNEYAPWEFVADRDSMDRAGRSQCCPDKRIRAFQEDRVFLFHQPGISVQRRTGDAAAVHRRPGSAGVCGHDHSAVHFL
jgi:hypothetical protein